MPIEIIVTDRKFFNQYNNDEDFAANPSQTTINLVGNPIENVKYTSTIDVSWGAAASAADVWDVENLGSDLFRFRKSATFVDDGFSIGDVVDWIFTSKGTTFTTEGTVSNVMTDWMYIQFVSTPPTFVGVTSSKSTSSTINGKSDLSAVIYRFGLIGNTETTNFISKLTSNNQAYYGESIAQAGPVVTMIPQGTYRDWVTGSAEISRQTNPSTYVQRFDIVHIFKINPEFVDGELTNLQNDIVSAVLAGGDSLKYVFEIDFQTSLSNPNSKKTVSEDAIIGSVGPFGSNFNGFNNNYTIVSVDYEDTATTTTQTGLLISQQTKATIIVEKIGGAFISTDRIGAFVEYLATASQYTNTLTDQTANFMYGVGYCLADGTPVNGTGSVTTVTATVDGNDDIVLEILTNYTTTEQKVLQAQAVPNFLIAIQIGDITITSDSSDRVILVAEAGDYSVDTDIPGLMSVTKFDFYTQDKVIGVEAGTTDFIGWNEDNMVVDGAFTLDTTKSAVINNLFMNVIAYDNVTGASFLLDSYEFDISNAVVSGGIQQLIISDSRNYDLVAGQFNDVTLSVGGNVAGVQTYNFTFAQKITWQDWIENLNAATVFFDATKPNDNLNFKASNYSDLSDFDIKFELTGNVAGISTLGVFGNTPYNFLSPDNIVFDYELDGNPTPIWSSTIETFTEDGVTNLNGGILTNGDNTLMKVTYTNSVTPATTAIDYWGWHHIEPFESLTAATIQENSNVVTNTDDLLIPIVGETDLLITVVAGKIVTQCLIDGTTVNSSVQYDLSSRLQSPNEIARSEAFVFETDSVDLPAFAPTIGTSSGSAFWDFGDGNTATGLGVSNAYGGTGDKTVFCTPDNGLTAITSFDLVQEDIVNQLDITGLVNCTSIRADFNTGMTSFIAATTSVVITRLNINNCDITGLLNLSGMTGLSNDIQLQDNPNMTGITNPATTQTILFYFANSCDLGYVDFTVMPNMTDINNCDIQLQGNSMTTAEVNQILVNLDSISVAGSFTGRSINIAGSNSAPDGSAGGFNGDAAVTSLIAKNFSVTTT